MAKKPERIKRPLQGEHLLPTNELYALYEEMNFKYFEGKLPEPPTIVLHWSNRLTAIGGKCTTFYDNKKNPYKHRITLSIHYLKKFPEQLKAVLTHEMIHMKIHGHGKDFIAEMDRIKALGGEVILYTKERAKKKERKWSYVCSSCWTMTKLYMRRLPYGGKNYTCKSCGGRLVELYDGQVYVPPKKNIS